MAETTHIHFLADLDAKSPRSRSQQADFFCGFPLWFLDGLLDAELSPGLP